MKLNELFKTKKSKPSFAENDLDKKLVKSLQKKSLPSLGQFKYLKRFLSKKEKITLWTSFSIMILAILSWAGFFVFSHRVVLPRNGGEYIEGLVGQPKLINPLFSPANDVDADLVSLLYAGLFKYENQKLIPYLASGYTVSEDGKEYIVKLRQDITWSDGNQITSNDVLYTMETIQLPEVNSPLFPSMQGVKMEKISDYEIKFTLTEPFAAFLNTLTVGILPEHIWSQTDPANLRLAKENLQPKIISGPWKFAKLIKNGTDIQSITLEQNEKFHGTPSFLDKLTFKFYYSYNEVYEALRVGDILASSFLPQDLQEKLNNKKVNNYKLNLPQYTALFFNQNTNAVLKETDFKKALALSINKEELVQNVLNGDSVVVNSPILPDSIGYYPDIEKINFDAVGANKILDEADWERIEPEKYFELQTEKIMEASEEELKNDPDWETNSTTIFTQKKVETEELIRQGMRPDQFFYRKDEDDNILSLTITTVENSEYQKVAETIARYWRDIGIQTNIQTISGNQINRIAIKDRNYEVLLYGEILGNDPDPYPFWHSSQASYPGLNLSMFADRNADKYLEEARISNDESTRTELYKKFQDLLVSELPAIFLYTPTYNFTTAKDIKGVSVNRIINPSDRYNDLKNWYIKTGWGWR